MFKYIILFICLNILMAIPIFYYENQANKNEIKDEKSALYQPESTEIEFENDDDEVPKNTVKDILSKFSLLKQKILKEYEIYQRELLSLIESDRENILLENFLHIYEKLFDNINLQFKYEDHMINNLAFKEHQE